jgi:hypothetical protein
MPIELGPRLLFVTLRVGQVVDDAMVRILTGETHVNRPIDLQVGPLREALAPVSFITKEWSLLLVHKPELGMRYDIRAFEPVRLSVLIHCPPKGVFGSLCPIDTNVHRCLRVIREYPDIECVALCSDRLGRVSQPDEQTDHAMRYHFDGGFMNTAEIISQIDAEIARLQGARALLVETPLKREPGRPKANKQPATPKKRHLSAKGRAAISTAMKARWAKRKKVA